MIAEVLISSDLCPRTNLAGKWTNEGVDLDFEVACQNPSHVNVEKGASASIAYLLMLLLFCLEPKRPCRMISGGRSAGTLGVSCKV